MVEMGTQLAILIGMVAGQLADADGRYRPVGGGGGHHRHRAWPAMPVSRAIPPAPATAPELKFNWNPFTETVRVLGITRSDRAVFNAVLGISWFWFFGTVLMAQLPIYTKLNLGGDGSVNTLVLTLFSLGTGIGSLLCERMSGKRVEIGLVPLGAFGLTAFGIDLFLARPGAAVQTGLDWRAFLQAAGSWRIVLDLTADRRVRRLLRGAAVRLRAVAHAA